MKKGKCFNINTMLKDISKSLELKNKDKTPCIIFHFSKYVPSEIKGTSFVLHTVLLNMLQLIIEKGHIGDIVLSIDAPEEFLYNEPVTFKITNIALKEEELIPVLQEKVCNDLKLLIDATLEFTHENAGSIILTTHLSIPELGCRRYYRLPSKDILDKNILLVIKGTNLALSITKMFKYYPMTVDLSINRYKDKFDLTKYDLLIVEDILLDEKLESLIKEAQNSNELKFVLLKNNESEIKTTFNHIDFLMKPVTPDNTYNLLVSLFQKIPTIEK